MVAAAPSVAEVRSRSFGRAKIIEALHLFGVSADGRTGAKALKAQLVQLIESGAGVGASDGMCVDIAPVPSPGPHDASAGAAAERDNRAVRELARRMQSSGGDFKPDDITFSVRSMLDKHAHSLPGALASLRPIEKQLARVRACLQAGEEVSDSVHRTVKACLQAPDTAVRAAMLAALQLDLDVRIKALTDKESRAKSGGQSGQNDPRRGPDPVLKAMGELGLARALWEYYKACTAKRPVYGQRAHMPYDTQSYLGQLYVSLSELLDPRVVQACKHMHSPKALRDFVVGWCFFWQRCYPPFQALGPRQHWTIDQWEDLPMHEIEGEDGLCPRPVVAPAHGDSVVEKDAGASDDEDEAGYQMEEDDDERGPQDTEALSEHRAVMMMLQEDGSSCG